MNGQYFIRSLSLCDIIELYNLYLFFSYPKSEKKHFLFIQMGFIFILFFLQLVVSESLRTAKMVKGIRNNNLYMMTGIRLTYCTERALFRFRGT